jgi:SPP1 family predicted phage head-tail adaptor
MRAGELRHRIAFQKRNASLDAFGGQLSTWSTIATVWADIRPMSGRELLAAQAINIDISHTVEIRYQLQFAGPKAVAAMRILYGDRIFNIHSSIDPDERHKTLELGCSEGLTNG